MGTERTKEYPNISDFALIGDMHTAALVGIDGSIEWCCLPRFDSPSVFAGVLDRRKGGFFRVAPADGGATCRQAYWPETNVLVTRFLGEEGGLELIDFMPVGAARRGQTEIIRQLRCVRGSMTVRMEMDPAFDYARGTHDVSAAPRGVRFLEQAGERHELSLLSDVEMRLEETKRGGRSVAEFTIDEGDVPHFILRDDSGGPPEISDDAAIARADEAFQQTVEYWRRWIGGCTYQGRWRETVHRSALALKLLTYEPTGAIIAAPTCGLPERIGGTRNWDYRYAWIRDGAFTLYALLRLGFRQEAEGYMSFLMTLCMRDGGESPLHVLYRVDGSTDLAEEHLDHLEGYRESTPVRIGNDAHDQLQLDQYGALMDAAYLHNKWGEPISAEFWDALARIVEWVCDNWEREDEGIWETRGGRQQFTYSKVMCWVAIERALRTADKRSLPCDKQRWTACRDAIFRRVLEEGYDDEIGSFMQTLGGDTLDASALIFPLVFFTAPTDPRILSTIDRIMRPPKSGGLVAHGLVFRYDPQATPDGVGGSEGTFNMCTFWLVEALTRAGRFHPERLSEARIIFERMLGLSNHVGLYAEELGFTGEALGNFPQAFTHLSLISSAWNLDRALNEA